MMLATVGEVGRVQPQDLEQNKSRSLGLQFATNYKDKMILLLYCSRLLHDHYNNSICSHILQLQTLPISCLGSLDTPFHPLAITHGCYLIDISGRQKHHTNTFTKMYTFLIALLPLAGLSQAWSIAIGSEGACVVDSFVERNKGDRGSTSQGTWDWCIKGITATNGINGAMDLSVLDWDDGCKIGLWNAGECQEPGSGIWKDPIVVYEKEDLDRGCVDVSLDLGTIAGSDDVQEENGDQEKVEQGDVLVTASMLELVYDCDGVL